MVLRQRHGITKRRLLTTGAIIAMLFAAAYYWLLIDNRMPPGRFDLDIAVLLEIAALHRLQDEVPALTIVPGHDAVAVARFEQAGLLQRGFR